MKIVKSYMTDQNIATTLMAIGMGIMLVCFPVLVFKSLEHSSANQPTWKSK